MACFNIFDNNQINSRKSVMACFNIFDVFDNNQINSRKSVMACFNIFDIFDIILHRVWSMQHASSTSLTYPGSCKSCFSRKPVFGGKVFLRFSIIYHIVDQHVAL